MRLIFMGTPAFAMPALAALIGAGHEIAAVYTQPPRAAGRGKTPRAGAVQTHAEAAGISVRYPATLKDGEAQAAFAALAADAAVVVAYGLILPQPILGAPWHGCLNVHASLLPRWRGAAPIQRAILAGDAETGITIMRLDEGLDTGPMLLSRRLAIGDHDAGALHDRLAVLGGEAIVTALAALADGSAVETRQSEAGVTYAAKLTPEDEPLDWCKPTAAVMRQICALAPRPGAHFLLDGERWKALSAEFAEGSGAPGKVLDDRLTVGCGEGALRLLRVQRPGRKAMPVADALRGRTIPAGTQLG
ncbi:MAG TPA: methionyl-tRNA formyltransferase [Alphaproteobacteria bacterium]|jgi:methionyl-tRNA formyltransferase|nr:methionyl-tRNA formyltransferase [Alphaproteobacteria bacterium]